jgi:hypothetical protein
VRVANAGGNGGLVKIEPGEIAGVGGIPKAQVNAVRAVVNGRLECRQAAGRANQFHGRCHNGSLGRGKRGIDGGIHSSKKWADFAKGITLHKVSPQSGSEVSRDWHAVR